MNILLFVGFLRFILITQALLLAVYAGWLGILLGAFLLTLMTPAPRL